MKLFPIRALALPAILWLLPFGSALAQLKPPAPITGCAVVDPPAVRLAAVVSPPGPPIPPGPPMQFCPGDIGGAVSGEVLDPSLLGLTMNLLKDGFHLTSFTLRAEAECDSNGNSIASVPVLDTAWRTDQAWNALSLSQRPASTPQGNLLDGGVASFWWNGFFYTLQLQFPYPIGVKTPMSPAFADGQSILLAAIAELAPGLDPACFYQRTEGTWENLASIAIGDPRPVIPAGFAQTSFELQYVQAPPSTCPGAVPPADSSAFFSATFGDPTGGMISISASSLPAGTSASPGSRDDFSINWANGKFQFGVFAQAGDGSPLSASTLSSIALRLDPAFAQACFFQSVTLSDADLPALGFNAPQVPAGYASTGESLTGYVVLASCPTHYDFRGDYSFYWSFAGGDGAQITASAVRELTDHPGPRTPPIVTDSCISWNDDKGTSYFVSGYSFGGAPPGIDVLIKVAQSMDPGLTIPK